MPLLHTWSLGVEEQFYLVCPALLALLARRSIGRRSALGNMLLFIAVVSFIGNVVTVRTDQLSGFYLPQYRAWELALGGWLAIAGKPIKRCWVAELAASTGLSVIVASAVLLPAKIAYPGAWALLPVGGACALLWPAQRSTITARLLALPPVVLIGRISYSFYLYHWPVLAFWRHYIGVDAPSVEERWILLALSFVCAFASWMYVEQVFRWRKASRGTVFAVAAISQLAVAAVCFGVFASNGVEARLPERLRGIGSLDLMWHWSCPHLNIFPELDKKSCVFGRDWNSAKTHIALWGDSNAGFGAPILDSVIAPRDVSAIYLVGCSPILTAEGPFLANTGRGFMAYCDIRRRQNIDFIRRHREISLIILMSAWGGLSAGLVRSPKDDLNAELGLQLLADGIDHLVAQVARPGLRFVIVSEIAKFNFDPAQCFLSQRIPLLRRPCSKDVSHVPMANFDRYQKPARDRLMRYGQYRGIEVLFPKAQMCTGDICPTVINGEFIYRDSGHLRRNLEPETYRILANKFGFSKIVTEMIAHPAGIRPSSVLSIQ